MQNPSVQGLGNSLPNRIRVLVEIRAALVQQQHCRQSESLGVFGGAPGILSGL